MSHRVYLWLLIAGAGCLCAAGVVFLADQAPFVSVLGPDRQLGSVQANIENTVVFQFKNRAGKPVKVVGVMPPWSMPAAPC